MKKLFALSAFAPLLFSTALAATPTVDKTPPTKDHDFSVHLVDKFNFFASQTGWAKLQNLAPSMLRLAQRDIILADVESMKSMTFQKWDAYKFPRKIFTNPYLMKDKSGKPYPKYKQDLYRKFNRDERQAFFNAMRTDVLDVAGGKNYYSIKVKWDLRKNAKSTVCLIGADLNVDSLKMAQTFGNIPTQLVTPDFKEKFENNDGFLSFVMLHESAHCGQKEVKDLNENMALFNETDADQKALLAYRQLINEGWDLDEKMPDNIVNLRQIAPYMGKDDALSIYSAVFPNVHATAGGLLGQENNAMQTQEVLKHTKMILGAVTYQTIAESEFPALKEKADKYMDELLAPPTKTGKKKLSKQQQDLYDQSKKTLEPYFVMASYQFATPQNIYYAARLVLELPFSTIKNEELVRREMSLIVQSWDALGLYQDEDEYQEYKKKFTTNADLVNGRYELMELDFFKDIGLQELPSETKSLEKDAKPLTVSYSTKMAVRFG